jgi:hypothetical protein
MGGPPPPPSTACNTHVPSSYNPTTPPNVVGFDDLSCNGLSWQFPPNGQMRHLWLEGHNNADNRLTSLVVPPGTAVTAFHNGPDNNDGQTEFGPGVYPDLRNKLDITNRWWAHDSLSRFQVRRTGDYAEFLRDCCLGTIPASDCANFAGPTQQACQSIMQHHCGLDLGWHQRPICKQWGASFPAEYDAIARRLCTQEGNKKDPYCACFNPENPDMVRPSCFDIKCTAGGYHTTEHKNAANACGTYCNLEINASADKSVLINNNSFVQNCGNEAATIRKEIADSKAPPQPPTPADPLAGNAGSGDGVGEPAKRKEEVKTTSKNPFGGDKKKTYLMLGWGGVVTSVISCCCLIILMIIMYMIM